MKVKIDYKLFYGTEAERLAFAPVQIHSGFYCEDTNKEYRWNGATWILINGSGTGGMVDHGNEYHTPDFATLGEMNSAIDNHADITASVHNFDVSGNAPAQAHGNAKHTSTFVTQSEIDSTMAAHTASHAPANAQKNSDILKGEIEAKLTGEISTHTHAGGSGTSPIWWGKVHAAYADGDPYDAAQAGLSSSTTVSPTITPTNIGVAVGRLVAFRFPVL